MPETFGDSFEFGKKDNLRPRPFPTLRIFKHPATLPIAEAFNSKGQNYVVKVKLETALGGKPKYAFLRADGTQIETKNLSSQFLQQFGM